MSPARGEIAGTNQGGNIARINAGGKFFD